MDGRIGVALQRSGDRCHGQLKVVITQRTACSARWGAQAIAARTARSRHSSSPAIGRWRNRSSVCNTVSAQEHRRCTLGGHDHGW